MLFVEIHLSRLRSELLGQTACHLAMSRAAYDMLAGCDLGSRSVVQKYNTYRLRDIQSSISDDPGDCSTGAGGSRKV